MHSQKLNSLFLVSFLTFSLGLNAQDKLDENILSKDRLNLFEYNNKKNEENSSKLKKDWVNPITLSFAKSYTDTNNTTTSSISINQPIFKSGGIYSAIKYANANYEYNNFDIELQKKELIKTATTLLFNLNIIDLNIKKNELLLKNKEIEVQRKKEQVMNGFLDTSSLDNAIIDANSIKNNLADLYYQKEELNYNFSNIASGDYKSFELPILSLNDEDTYLKNNLELAKAKADIEQNDNFVDMTISKYLPQVNANFNHKQNHEKDNGFPTNENVNSYGFSVSIPLDIRTFNDIETQRINYLSSKLNLKNQELEEKNFYRTKLSKIKMYDNKKEIAKSDYELYSSLLEVIIQERDAQLKTQSDVDILKNSQEIRSIELNILELQKQIELLELYAKMS